MSREILVTKLDGLKVQFFPFRWTKRSPSFKLCYVIERRSILYSLFWWTCSFMEVLIFCLHIWLIYSLILLWLALSSYPNVLVYIHKIEKTLFVPSMKFNHKVFAGNGLIHSTMYDGSVKLFLQENSGSQTRTLHSDMVNLSQLFYFFVVTS